MTIASDNLSRAVELPKRTLSESVRKAQPLLVAGLALVAAIIMASYSDTLGHLIRRWSTEPDYSHGFLVPLFSCWLLWHRRSMLETVRELVRGRWLGMALLVSSALVRLLAEYFDTPLPGAFALIICVASVPVLIGGFPMLRWAWPAIVFLLFMVPLPGIVAGRLSGPLQHIATVCSTYVLQTVGVPAIASGNVIWLSHGKIGVVEACSGLRMLMMFGAVTLGMVFLLKISNWEKVCLLVSSAGIAVVANIFRISATGVTHELVSAEFADKIFHDFAGWIMMPLAMSMLGIEVLLLSKLFPMIPLRPPVIAGQSRRAIDPMRSR